MKILKLILVIFLSFLSNNISQAKDPSDLINDIVNEASLILDQSTVVISLSGLVDIDTEKRRLGDELKEHNRNEAQTRGKLSNKQFTSKAPEEVIQREEDKLNKILERKERLNEIIRQLN